MAFRDKMELVKQLAGAVKQAHANGELGETASALGGLAKEAAKEKASGVADKAHTALQNRLGQ
jgi:hypothetical protein